MPWIALSFSFFTSTVQIRSKTAASFSMLHFLIVLPYLQESAAEGRA
jgi:hypothetical protein